MNLGSHMNGSSIVNYLFFSQNTAAPMKKHFVKLITDEFSGSGRDISQRSTDSEPYRSYKKLSCHRDVIKGHLK